MTIYTPGEAASSTILLYSTALNDPPDYYTDSSMLHCSYLRIYILVIFKARN